MLDKSDIGNNVVQVKTTMQLQDGEIRFEKGEKLKLLAVDEEAEREGDSTTIYMIGRDGDEAFRMSDEQIHDIDMLELLD
jgi:hypothetical protein